MNVSLSLNYFFHGLISNLTKPVVTFWKYVSPLYVSPSLPKQVRLTAAQEVKKWHIFALRTILPAYLADYSKEVEGLTLLSEWIQDPSIDRSDEEWEEISGVLQRVLSQQKILEQIQNLHEVPPKTGYLCQALCAIYSGRKLQLMQVKIESLQRGNGEKLTPEEFSFLAQIPNTQSTTAELIKHCQSSALAEASVQMVQYMNSPTFSHIQKIVQSAFQFGTPPDFLLVDRETLMDGLNMHWNLKELAITLFGGPWRHISFIKQTAEGQYQLSHMSGYLGRHVLSPLSASFRVSSLFFQIDIEPLIPSSIPKRRQYVQLFNREIRSLAAEERAISFAGDQEMVFSKLFSRTYPPVKMEEVDYLESELCSGFICTTILKAIAVVNQNLSEQNFPLIPNPFGDYQNPHRITIPNLLVALKTGGCLKILPPNPLLAQSVALPTFD